MFSRYQFADGLLEVSNAILDKVTLYHPDSNGGFLEITVGDVLPFSGLTIHSGPR